MPVIVKGILYGLLFIFFVGLVVFGQATVGYQYLGIQVIGLVGLLWLLHQYNKQYK